MHGVRQELKRLLAEPGIIRACGVGDAGQARLVELAGFPVVYMSGMFVSFTYGLPDVGYLTLSEMAQRAAEIVRRVNTPLIADADDGYGDAVAVTRTVQEYERAGVAALHLEDEFPKKFGTLASIPSMVGHIRAALAARTDKNMLIIARTDAMRPWRKDLKEGSAEDDCVRRCLAYAEAGADIIMIMSPGSESALRRFCREIPKPVLICAGRWDYDPSARDLEDIGVKIVVYPLFIQQKIVPVMRSSLEGLLASGRVNLSENECAQVLRGKLDDILGLAQFKDIQDVYRG